jgi:hypothetical protein
MKFAAFTSLAVAHDKLTTPFFSTAVKLVISTAKGQLGAVGHCADKVSDIAPKRKSVKNFFIEKI